MALGGVGVGGVLAIGADSAWTCIGMSMSANALGMRLDVSLGLRCSMASIACHVVSRGLCRPVWWPKVDLLPQGRLWGVDTGVVCRHIHCSCPAQDIKWLHGGVHLECKW